MALAADVVIACESAYFLQAFTRIGLIPDVGGTYFLPRAMGLAKAIGSSIFADKIMAAEAQEIGLIYEYVEDDNFNYEYDERWFSPIDRTLRRELKSHFDVGKYWFDTTGYIELIDLRIKYQNGYFKFLVPKDRVSSSSARIFALWITVPAIIMVIISLIFLKNQTRPIINLARAAERFGKGEEIEEFKPSGAMEIRQAGHEFDKMRKRIQRHLNQRNEMLSGISHDLRTPLTRMKLQIAFIKDEDLAKKLTEDINQMEKMLNEYLQFTSSSYIEKDEMFNLSELISEIIKKYDNENISQDLKPRIYINGRKNLIYRCLNNLIDNSLKYANKVVISLNKKNTNLFLTIDDDGPGISKDEYENVFKPFSLKTHIQLDHPPSPCASILFKAASKRP